MDLYARTWQAAPLHDNEYVISADEKTSIQAGCRCHPTLAPGQGRATRVNHEYERGGALAYLAAYDVHRALVFGRCEASTGRELTAHPMLSRMMAAAALIRPTVCARVTFSCSTVIPRAVGTAGYKEARTTAMASICCWVAQR